MSYVNVFGCNHSWLELPNQLVTHVMQQRGHLEKSFYDHVSMIKKQMFHFFQESVFIGIVLKILVQHVFLVLHQHTQMNPTDVYHVFPALCVIQVWVQW